MDSDSPIMHPTAYLHAHLNVDIYTKGHDIYIYISGASASLPKSICLL